MRRVKTASVNEWVDMWSGDPNDLSKLFTAAEVLAVERNVEKALAEATRNVVRQELLARRVPEATASGDTTTATTSVLERPFAEVFTQEGTDELLLANVSSVFTDEHTDLLNKDFLPYLELRGWSVKEFLDHTLYVGTPIKASEEWFEVTHVNDERNGSVGGTRWHHSRREHPPRPQYIAYSCIRANQLFWDMRRIHQEVTQQFEDTLACLDVSRMVADYVFDLSSSASSPFPPTTQQRLPLEDADAVGDSNSGGDSDNDAQETTDDNGGALVPVDERRIAGVSYTRYNLWRADNLTQPEDGESYVIETPRRIIYYSTEDESSEED